MMTRDTPMTQETSISNYYERVKMVVTCDLHGQNKTHGLMGYCMADNREEWGIHGIYNHSWCFQCDIARHKAMDQWLKTYQVNHL